MAKTVEYAGETVRFMDLATRLGLSRSALRSRMRKGWPPERWAEPVSREPAPTTPCSACGSPVERNPAGRVAGRGLYCSRKCAGSHYPARHGHGRAGQQSPTFKCWHGMKQRCLNPNHINYAQYGGRGITVCAEWLDFTGFLRDMRERPDGMTLDRIDGNGNYEPGNCRWATQKQQCNNWTKANTHVEYEGATYTLQELSDKFGLNRYTLRRRIFDMKWPQEHWGDQPSKTKRALGF